MTAVAYIDESGDHNLKNIIPHSPVLTVAAVVLKKEDISLYEQCFNALKQHHFGSDEVILVSSLIRKQRENFNCLRDQTKREEFFRDFNELVTATPCTVISVTINKINLLQRYIQPDNPYGLALKYLMERLTFWSRCFHSFGPVELLAEARGKKEDDQLKKIFSHVQTIGTDYVNREDIQRVCQSLRMETKAMNIPGLQLADMIAYPLARRAMGKADPRTMAIIEPKLFGGQTGNIENYGAKVFPT